jgi:hypothetical protein
MLWDVDALLDQAVDKLCLPVKVQEGHMDENILLCLHFKAYMPIIYLKERQIIPIPIVFKLNQLM